MKRAARIWFGIVLAFIAAGAIAGAVIGGSGIGGRIGSAVIGALFLFFAFRAWIGTEDSTSGGSQH